MHARDIIARVRLTLFRKRKIFRIFLENSEYREVNKTRFLVLEKNARNIIFLNFSNFPAPLSRKLGRYSKFSGMGIPSQSNGLSTFFQEFLFRKKVKRTHPKMSGQIRHLSAKYDEYTYIKHSFYVRKALIWNFYTLCTHFSLKVRIVI